MLNDCDRERISWVYFTILHIPKSLNLKLIFCEVIKTEKTCGNGMEKTLSTTKELDLIN